MKRRQSPTAHYAIIGTGLIGASIGLALRRHSPKTRVTGYDRSRKNARAALRRGALTSVATTVDDAIARADVIVLATPRKQAQRLLARVLKSAPQKALVVDVAGLKAQIVAASLRLRKSASPTALFIGGHPMAGNEHQGPHFAASDLFVGRTFALCVPTRKQRMARVRQVEEFVGALGGRPLYVAAADHDRVVAVTSAMPQLISSAAAMAAQEIAGRYATLKGPGLDGVTRLASSPADLWADDLIANKRNVLRALNVFEKRLRGLRQAVAAGERMRLRGLLRAGARAKRRLSPR